MPFVKAKDGTQIHVKDWDPGTCGTPVVLIHGWPLNADMWEHQAIALANAGHRVIAYDRRGFGRSDQPWSGYDYDTFAGDLADVLDQGDIRNAALVGFSMGGGEVARYIGRHGSERVSKAALLGAVTPMLVKTDDHPEGVDASVFEGIKDGLKKDRQHFLAKFMQDFYGRSLLKPAVSDEVLQWSFLMAMQASPKATLDCVDAFGTTDFRQDLAKFTMPTLIIHGTADKTVPIDVSGRAAAALIPSAKLIEYDGEPHGFCATAKDRVSEDLLAFLRG